MGKRKERKKTCIKQRDQQREEISAVCHSCGYQLWLVCSYRVHTTHRRRKILVRLFHHNLTFSDELREINRCPKCQDTLTLPGFIGLP